mmetsp:Transcript_30515/g.66520  ORF Transcript_30515/g.66520 Transcript_30515/m.66520 type:complete len:89 (-) Transcript_30515:685-951(-)|eukprot:CAMPEP_0116892426 /NCGR_PEP_ID=MMETSP0467-20121206/2651_1 /TAXON_ID=283647 /ORGANISM="Mesodinium pulex, Strain SPMC105" /LENGTH=88 /DNA_ID=CAMNT_0004561547 /DNA_START=286 /DNA_END=552 /DNA_ORIENTATION=+
MATEEASIIAAASNAAKCISAFGGFRTEVLSNLMIGQIVINKELNPLESVNSILANLQTLKDIGNNAIQDMMKYGGGIKYINTRTYDY